jgi:hypothetical protein
MHDIGGNIHLRNRHSKRVYRLGLTSSPYRVPLWPVNNVVVEEHSAIECGHFVSDLIDHGYTFSRC